MAIQTITSQQINVGPDAGLSFGRWDGSITARNSDGDSVTLKTSPDALAGAVKSYVSGARYVTEEDAPAVLAQIEALVATATETVRLLHQKHPSLGGDLKELEAAD